MTPEEENPYVSPQPPQRTRSRTTLPGIQFSDHNDAVERPEGDHGGWFLMDLRFLGTLAGVITLSYLALSQAMPMVWAVLNVVLLGLGFGLFTTRVLLGIENPRWFWPLSPVIGLAWLVLFWGLFQLFRGL